MRAHCGNVRGLLASKQKHDLRALQRSRGGRRIARSARPAGAVRAVLGEALMNAPEQIGLAYELSLIQHPILTNVTTAGVLYTCSDIYAQTHQARTQKAAAKDDFSVEVPRALRYGLFGICDGCSSYFWFIWLDSVIPGTDGVALVEKMCTDFALLTPTWSALFLLYMGIFSEGGNVQAGVERVQKDWVTLYKRNVITWAPLNAIVYGLVPLDKRVLAFATFTFLYTITLSLWSEARQSDVADGVLAEVEVEEA
uniref:Uncharacterized protein n=1 Tax=Pyramimonas obovata TaxID=1411642 RepID=A0A7S0RXI5_9CHLO|mmetsp:Transcript_9250/g.19099  ORF Transcript_9250/g.19099 Transcript_9250/m.19099 type:complete len:254 (+) Transcript_9250:75-836(+)|eukprot:CAMPEP_0118935204 /NCGR_PEP_ID=MMETSP1169-20130426/15146_1 /TAXON_ID=36882 /ORGANISM="Pyramimonas obovata, Strain CCMP722" /LENGTH=253 /DNA_ID=CAMNT_0006878201 /DNA_START=72 /DNA_END=833 /DNA_ORIENTATION=+